MSKSKHAPRPWLPSMMNTRLMNVVPHRLHGFNVTIIGGLNAQIIAHAHGRTEKECEANARLIAAAPDLLEVAQRILDRGYVSESIEEERGDHLALVAAIAKAEGRS